MISFFDITRKPSVDDLPALADYSPRMNGMHVEMSVPALICLIREMAELSVAPEEIPKDAAAPNTKPI